MGPRALCGQATITDLLRQVEGTGHHFVLPFEQLRKLRRKNLNSEDFLDIAGEPKESDDLAGPQIEDPNATFPLATVVVLLSTKIAGNTAPTDPEKSGLFA